MAAKRRSPEVVVFSEPARASGSNGERNQAKQKERHLYMVGEVLCSRPRGAQLCVAKKIATHRILRLRGMHRTLSKYSILSCMHTVRKYLLPVARTYATVCNHCLSKACVMPASQHR